MNPRKLFQQLLAESDFTHTAMIANLDEFCEAAGWDLGHLFVVQEGPRRELASFNHWYSRIDEEKLELLKTETEKMRVIWGGDVPGRVIASGSPEWFSSAQNLPSSKRMELARSLGIQSGFRVSCPRGIGCCRGF